MSGEKFFRSKVIGVGGYLPDKVVTNDELSKTVETVMNGLRKELE